MAKKKKNTLTHEACKLAEKTYMHVVDIRGLLTQRKQGHLRRAEASLQETDGATRKKKKQPLREGT